VCLWGFVWLTHDLATRPIFASGNAGGELPDSPFLEVALARLSIEPRPHTCFRIFEKEAR
jgi:hypothetical protein